MKEISLITRNDGVMLHLFNLFLMKKVHRIENIKKKMKAKKKDEIRQNKKY